MATDNITVDNVKMFVSELKEYFRINPMYNNEVNIVINKAITAPVKPTQAKEVGGGGGLEDSIDPLPPSGGKKTKKKTTDLTTKKIKKKIIKALE